MDINRLTDKMKMLAFTTSDEGSKALYALCTRKDKPLPVSDVNHVMREYIYLKAFLVSFYYFYRKCNMNDWEQFNELYLHKLGVAFARDVVGYGNNYDELVLRYDIYWKFTMDLIKKQQDSHKPDLNALLDEIRAMFFTITGSDPFVHVEVTPISFKILMFYPTYDWIKKEIDKYCGSPYGNNSGCYIATCVYGSYDCPEVWVLRRFRDNILMKKWYGRFFVNIYYAISPTLVRWFGNTKWFNDFCKPKLDKMVGYLSSIGIKDTPYVD